MSDPMDDHPDLRDLGHYPPAQQLARDRLYATIGNAVNIGVGLGIVTWAFWGISVIVGWIA